MKTIKKKMNELDMNVIPIGIAGEKNHTRIEIDCTPMFTEYPEAIAELIVQPPYGDKYTPGIVREQNLIIWTITDRDLQYTGRGEFQLKFTSGRTVALSPLARMSIGREIG